MMAKGKRVIANSRYTASVIEARDARAKDRIRVIYRGVDRNVFDPAAVDAQAVDTLRAAWGVPPGTRIVLHAARLTSIKGQRDLIAAAALANAEGALHATRVVILAGDAPGAMPIARSCSASSSVMASATECGSSDIAGRCLRLILQRRSRSPHRRCRRAFGRTSAEAQAMGCPVIVPDLGALPETILAPGQSQTGFTGWLFPPRDIASLASRIGRALDLRRCGAGGNRLSSAGACGGELHACADARGDACRL